MHTATASPGWPSPQVPAEHPLRRSTSVLSNSSKTRTRVLLRLGLAPLACEDFPAWADVSPAGLPRSPAALASVSSAPPLCLCLCQTDLQMGVARQTPPNRQKLCTLHSADSRGGSAAGRSVTLDPSLASSQQHSFQLGPPSSDSMRPALSIFRRRKSPDHAANLVPAAQPPTRLEDQRSHGVPIALRFLRFLKQL